MIVPLAGRGVGVIAAPIPLTSLGDDVTALERVIDRTAGPVVLVSHAYAGAVISSARNSRVKALVLSTRWFRMEARRSRTCFIESLRILGRRT